ncbi:MAG: ribonuclease III, partial [Prevotella sp.]|nr:ribonuclease III [Prevotella sp.]
GQGFSKKEAQQECSKDPLQRLRREPQFIDAIFAAKSNRTKMEEEPTAVAPDLEAEKEFIIKTEKPVTLNNQETSDNQEPSVDEFDLSGITHNRKELSREDIIAAAETAAYQEE